MKRRSKALRGATSVANAGFLIGAFILPNLWTTTSAEQQLLLRLILGFSLATVLGSATWVITRYLPPDGKRRLSILNQKTFAPVVSFLTNFAGAAIVTVFALRHEWSGSVVALIVLVGLLLSVGSFATTKRSVLD